jgi:hypothetical protein
MWMLLLACSPSSRKSSAFFAKLASNDRMPENIRYVSYQELLNYSL